MPQRARLFGEQPVKGGGVDLCALELRPGVAVGIGGVDTADEILRQAARLLQPVERLEGRGGDDAAEIEDNGREAHGVINIPALGSSEERRVGKECVSKVSSRWSP